MLESWINVHALFALLLCGLVLARCEWRIKRSPSMPPTDMRELSRHLSRIVYLLLYIVVGVRLSIGIMNSIWHGSAIDFSLFDDRLRGGPDRARWNSTGDFQLFLATGLLVLIFVRILGITLWRRFFERAAPTVERAAPTNAAIGTDVNRASKRP